MGTSLRLPQSHRKKQKKQNKKKNVHTLGGGEVPWDLCDLCGEGSEEYVTYFHD